MRLTDLARMRLESISFFLAGFLLSAFLVKVCWNYLAKDSTVLPRLGFGRAVALVAVWGLAFVLVLTMISGARELMTPGAWKKEGATHKLKAAEEARKAHDAEEALRERRFRLENLRNALWEHARSHEGRFPGSSTDPAISESLWTLPEAHGARYVYFGAGPPRAEDRVLVMEPDFFPGDRWVLLSGGAIRRWSPKQLEEAVAAEER